MNQQVKELTPEGYMSQARHIEEWNEMMAKLKKLARYITPEVHTSRWKTQTGLKDDKGMPIFKWHEITLNRWYPEWVYKLQANGLCRQTLINNKNWQTDPNYVFVDI